MSSKRAMQYAERLSKMIKIETVSVKDSKDISKFLKLQEFMREEFSALFRVVECEVIDGSLLLKWKGTDGSLEPVLLMNHQDVVEASGEWKYPPFSGTIAEGRVWGRGTLDTKGGLCTMLTAADELAREGFTPRRDTYFVSTCTEETGGEGGNAISNLLKERGIQFYMVPSRSSIASLR